MPVPGVVTGMFREPSEAVLLRAFRLPLPARGAIHRGASPWGRRVASAEFAVRIEALHARQAES